MQFPKIKLTTILLGENNFNTLLVAPLGAPLVQTTETINLDPASHQQCQRSINEFPFHLNNGYGGYLQTGSKSGAVVCGVSGRQDVKDKCYFLPSGSTRWIQVEQSLMEHRDHAASIVINDGKTLWITGGGGYTPKDKLRSTDFVTLLDNGSISITPGPDLPLGFDLHCLVKLNRTTAMLIGGASSEAQWDKNHSTYFLDIPEVTDSDNVTATLRTVRGPDLNKGRGEHSCGVLTNPADGNQQVVIAAGGLYPGWTEMLTVERWSQQGWIRGPDMPRKVKAAPGVTSPDGKSLFIIGGLDMNGGAFHSPVIYQLAYRNGCWGWSEMQQKLQDGRRNHAAMLVPDSYC